jgi:protein SCO1/2
VDTNSVLKALAKKQEVDETRWRLVRTNESSVRELSAVLGISYRKLDDGNYNHASVLTLLDRNGVMVAKLDGLGSPTETILQAMKQQTAGKSAQPGGAR